MVASGVPIPNGNHHVEEIAKMALDLLAKGYISTESIFSLFYSDHGVLFNTRRKRRKFSKVYNNFFYLFLLGFVICF